MNEMLNPDQIAALFEAAKQGQLPEQTASTGQRRGQRMRTVDFSRPDQVHHRPPATDRPGDRRVLPDGGDPAVGASCVAPIELETINTTQADLVGSTGTARRQGSLRRRRSTSQPLGTRMLMTVEQPFVLMCLDALLGGSPDRAAA